MIWRRARAKCVYGAPGFKVRLSDCMNRKVKPWIVATFLLPGLLMYGYFFFIPAIQSFYYSLTEWNGFKAEKVFIGLDNFISLLHDKTFLQALGNTMLFLLLGGVLIFSIALLFTYLITRPGFRGRKAFSNFFYFPNMISQAALAVLWVFFFNPEFGLLNMVLEAIGLGEWCIPWLGSRMSGMVCIIAVSCISFVGFYLILLLSGCDKIPNTYQEAASIDGATDLVCFFKITLPLLRDVLVISISLWIINAIKYFELIWAMFKGKSTMLNTLGTYMFTMAFGVDVPVFKLGYGSAIAVVYALILGIFYRNITWKSFWKIVVDSAKMSGMIVFLIGVSNIMGWVMAFTQIPQAISAALLGLTNNPIIILLIMNVILLIAGTFMDVTPAILIFTPLFLPIVKTFGMDPIQFGLILVYNLCIGNITPPVGNTLFVSIKIGNTTLARVMPYMLMYYVAILIGLLLVTYVPAVSLALPAAAGLV